MVDAVPPGTVVEVVEDVVEDVVVEDVVVDEVVVDEVVDDVGDVLLQEWNRQFAVAFGAKLTTVPSTTPNVPIRARMRELL
jgi:hypothetical protein